MRAWRQCKAPCELMANTSVSKGLASLCRLIYLGSSLLPKTWWKRLLCNSNRFVRSSNTAYIDSVGLASPLLTAPDSELSFSVSPGGLHIIGCSAEPIQIIIIPSISRSSCREALISARWMESFGKFMRFSLSAARTSRIFNTVLDTSVKGASL